MRKWTLLFLAAMLAAMGITYSPASAANTAFRLGADRAEASAGDTVQLTVSGTGLVDVYGYEAVVTYDSDKWTFVSARNALPKGNASESAGFAVTPVTASNKATFAFTKVGKIAGVGGDQPLAVFTFRARKAGNSAFGLSSVKVVHADVTADKFSPGLQTNIPIKPGDGSGSVSIYGRVNAGGTLAVELQQADLLQAIQSATNGKLRISVRPENGQSFRNVEVTLPVDIVLKEGARIHEIVIDTGLAVITIPADPARGVLSSGSKKLTLTEGKVDASSLPGSVRNVIGSSQVYDFKLSVDGVALGALKGRPISVEVPYTLKSGEHPGQVVAYFIGGDGRLEVVKNANYQPSSGTVIFRPEHFSQYAAVFAGVSFKDLSGFAWAQESVEALAAREIVAGTGSGAFQPNRPVTRAEFIRMLMGAADLIDDQAKSTFADVKAGAWYTSAIASAQKLGIVKGKSDGTFGINDPITRQDTAVMIYKAAEVLKADLGTGTSAAAFSDQAAVSGYAAEAVRAMQRSGLIQGMGNGKFEPKAQANRAQAAVILYKLLTLLK